MSTCEHIVLMAAYNEAMNDKLYAAAAQLPPAALFEDRKAFFGSLFATLNHLAVADTIWLKRFCAHPARQAALDTLRDAPAPAALSQPLATDLPGLLGLRRQLDRIIRHWAAELTPVDLEHVLRYANTKGVVSHKRYASLILHFFNHQTHHRGQCHMTLTALGKPSLTLDLIYFLRSEGREWM